MKITIEFDPDELARSAASQVVPVAPEAAATSAPGAPQLGLAMGAGAPIDAGHAPGAGGAAAEPMAGTGAGADNPPPEIAAMAAAIGAISAGAAPALH